MTSVISEPNIEETLDEVTALATELRNSEKNLDEIIAKGKAIKLSIESMREYQETTLSFRDIKAVTNENKNSDIILWLTAENKELEQLRQQNNMLNTSIGEHEAVIEIVMTKYRNQINELMKIKEADLIRAQKLLESKRKAKAKESPDSPLNEEDSKGTPQDEEGQSKVLEDRIATMASIAKEMADQSDAYTFHLEGEIQRLKTENSGLRELLDISFSTLQNASEENSNSSPKKADLSQDMSNTVYNHQSEDSGDKNSAEGSQVPATPDNSFTGEDIRMNDLFTHLPTNKFDQSNSVSSSSNELGNESDDTIVDQ